MPDEVPAVAVSATPAPKPGWRTTEFALTVISTLLGFAVVAGLVDLDGQGSVNKVCGLIAATLASLGYTVSRGLAKQNK